MRCFPIPGPKRFAWSILPELSCRIRSSRSATWGATSFFYREAQVLVEAEVPPCGYKTIYIEAAEGTEEPRYPEDPVDVLDSGFARLQLGSSGIETLQDKGRQVTYRRAGNPVYYSTTETWRYHSGPIGDKANVRDAEWKLVEEGVLRTSAEMTGMVGEHAIRMRVFALPYLGANRFRSYRRQQGRRRVHGHRASLRPPGKTFTPGFPSGLRAGICPMSPSARKRDWSGSGKVSSTRTTGWITATATRE